MFNLCIKLAVKDLMHDKRVSLFIIAALIAIITPILLLFGLKEGVVEQLQQELREKPGLLEIKASGNTYKISTGQLIEIEERPDANFVIGLTRSLNNELAIYKTRRAALNMASGDLYTEIIPTKTGDPLFKKESAIVNANTFGVSQKLAKILKLQEGDDFYLRINRRVNDQNEFEVFNAKVGFILDQGKFTRNGLFVPVEFLVAIEMYIDGQTDVFDSGMAVPEQYKYANMRIYAKDIDSVLSLSDWLGALGIKTESQIAAIQNVKTIDGLLNFLFSVIAITALLGGVVSLIGSLLANIERKKYTLSVLRLLGLNKKNIRFYITVQVIVITLISFVISMAFYYLGSSIFNNYLGYSAYTSGFTAYLDLKQIGMAFIITIVLALLVSIIGARQATYIDPAESLREI